MKKIFLALLLLFLVSATTVSAQDNQKNDLRQMFAGQINNRLTELMMESNGKSMAKRALYTSTLNLQMYLQRQEYCDELGITEEQKNKILGETDYAKLMQKASYKNVISEQHSLLLSIFDPADLTMEKVSDENLRKLVDFQSEINDIINSETDEIIKNTLTPQQLRKSQEFMISIMSENPLVSPTMFECLDLSEEQSKQMQKIMDDVLPEYEKNMIESFRLSLEQDKKVVQMLMASDEPITDQKVLNEKINELRSKNSETPEFKAIMKKWLDNNDEVLKKIKFQTYDILTDEQMDRLSQLVNNPSDRVKKMLDQIRKKREELDASGQWQPGPGSWKPGDPIPGEYIEHRKASRFPKKK